MKRDELLARVIDLISPIIKDPHETCIEVVITIDSNLSGDLGMGDEEVGGMRHELEGEFGLDIPDEETERFRTVKDVLNFLAERLNIAAEQEVSV